MAYLTLPHNLILFLAPEDHSHILPVTSLILSVTSFAFPTTLKPSIFDITSFAVSAESNLFQVLTRQMYWKTIR